MNSEVQVPQLPAAMVELKDTLQRDLCRSWISKWHRVTAEAHAKLWRFFSKTFWGEFIKRFNSVTGPQTHSVQEGANIAKIICRPPHIGQWLRYTLHTYKCEGTHFHNQSS